MFLKFWQQEILNLHIDEIRKNVVIVQKTVRGFLARQRFAANLAAIKKYALEKMRSDFIKLEIE